MSVEMEAVIGLEVHVQLNTASKLFCGCSTRFGAEPNSQICPVCTGQPGVLPVLNRQAVVSAVRLGVALGCTIRQRSRFARKNYFYPDLPKGYQVSQYDEPIGEHGTLEIWEQGQLTPIRVTRIHLEEDAGKNVHATAATTSMVDLNRAGVPLIEVVSEPDLSSPEQAAAYMRAMRAVVRVLGISDGNMEQGSLRCDANVSVRPKGAEKLGTKAEIKNINSFKFVQKALEYEISRQIAAVQSGETIVQQTRLWDTERGVTKPMRSKEQAHDYRYFPDPDLPPVVVEDDLLAQQTNVLPELPLRRRQRLMQQHQLSDHDAGELTREKELADYFEQAVAAGANPKRCANWIMTELLSRVSDAREVIGVPVTAEALAGLLGLIDSGKVSSKLAKQIWPKMWDSRRSAEQIATEEDLFQQSDASAIEAQIRALLEANPDKVEQYRGGKQKVMGWFVGQVMKATGGKANPSMVNSLLKKSLDE